MLVAGSVAGARERLERLEAQLEAFSATPLPLTATEALLAARGISPRRFRRKTGWFTWVACLIVIVAFAYLVVLILQAAL